MVLYSEGPMFRRSYVQKVLCSENICSEGPDGPVGSLLRLFNVDAMSLWTTALFWYFGAVRIGPNPMRPWYFSRTYAQRLRTCRRSPALSLVRRVVRGVVRCYYQMSRQINMISRRGVL